MTTSPTDRAKAEPLSDELLDSIETAVEIIERAAGISSDGARSCVADYVLRVEAALAQLPAG
ncbi:MAG: hypothetical protein AAF548_12925 [Actinomycetota bacterium]